MQCVFDILGADAVSTAMISKGVDPDVTASLVGIYIYIYI
jgi:hypothetical protein